MPFEHQLLDDDVLVGGSGFPDIGAKSHSSLHGSSDRRLNDGVMMFTSTLLSGVVVFDDGTARNVNSDKMSKTLWETEMAIAIPQQAKLVASTERSGGLAD